MCVCLCLLSLRPNKDAGYPGAGPYVCGEDWILVLLNSMVNSLLNLLPNPNPVTSLFHSLSLSSCPSLSLYWGSNPGPFMYQPCVLPLNFQVQGFLFSEVSYLSEAHELLPRVNDQFSLMCDTGFQRS